MHELVSGEVVSLVIVVDLLLDVVYQVGIGRRLVGLQEICEQVLRTLSSGLKLLDPNLDLRVELGDVKVQGC